MTSCLQEKSPTARSDKARQAQKAQAWTLLRFDSEHSMSPSCWRGAKVCWSTKIQHFIWVIVIEDKEIFATSCPATLKFKTWYSHAHLGNQIRSRLCDCYRILTPQEVSEAILYSHVRSGVFFWTSVTTMREGFDWKLQKAISMCCGQHI